MRRPVPERCCENCLPDTLDISEYLVIPKAKNPVPMINEPTVANSVATPYCVLAAIDLNDESPLTTNKIHNVWSNRLLPNKLEAIKRSRA